MTITYRFFTTSFTTLGIALVAQFLFHAEPAVAKGGVDNPTVVEDGGGSLTVDDGGGSLTVDDGGGSLNVDILSQPPLTHMGQFPVDHVTLVGVADAACTGASIATTTLSPSGVLGSVPFTVPSGRVLVITDMSATVTEAGVPWDEGDFAVIGLKIASPERVLFQKFVEISAAVAAATQGVVPIDGHSISGALIGENKVPCVQGSFTGGGSTVSNIILHGYLIDQ